MSKMTHLLIYVCFFLNSGKQCFKFRKNQSHTLKDKNYDIFENCNRFGNRNRKKVDNCDYVTVTKIKIYHNRINRNDLFSFRL